jgi:predicted aldo/keto reductase-like oxidoreductase
MDEVETAFGPGGVMEMVSTLKPRGIARNVGITAHNEDAALRCLELYDFDTVLFPFNWFMNMEHGMGSRLVKEAKKRGMGVLCMKAFIERAWNSEEEKKASPFPKSWCKPINVEDEPFGVAAMKYALSLGVDTLIPPGNYASFSFAVDHIDECLRNPLNDEDRLFLQKKLETVRGKEFF